MGVLPPACRLVAARLWSGGLACPPSHARLLLRALASASEEHGACCECGIARGVASADWQGLCHRVWSSLPSQAGKPKGLELSSFSFLPLSSLLRYVLLLCHPKTVSGVQVQVGKGCCLLHVFPT